MSPAKLSIWNLILLGSGLAALAASIWMPHGWYDAVTAASGAPPTDIKGVTLLQWILAIEGIALLLLGILARSYAQLGPNQLVSMPSQSDERGDCSAKTAAWILVAITALALILRVIAISADFWLDEIRATLDATEMSVLEIFAVYIRSNVHILNTLLMKGSFALFGEAEWSARLPVVVFGTASIPALYWVSRECASRTVGLVAALLLATSYHHILFSQNARGYVPYIFFSLCSSGLLVRGLREDRLCTWALYVACMVLNFASILISGFVFAAHVATGLACVFVLKRRGQHPGPLIRRLVAVFGIAATLGFHLYSVQLPQVLAYLDATYASKSAGYWLFSFEFVDELQRGIFAGFGPVLWLGALPFLALALAGLVTLFRRHWPLATALTLPLAFTAILLFVKDLTVSPRFFIFVLPVAILAGAVTLDAASRSLARRLKKHPRVYATSMCVVVAMFLLTSLTALPTYYATPLQPYRQSMSWAAKIRRHPDDIIIAIHTARRGCAYYAKDAGLTVDEDLFLADSLGELDAIQSSHKHGQAILLTSMPRALDIVHPSLSQRIASEWIKSKSFSAKIGDGDITIWTPRR